MEPETALSEPLEVPVESRSAVVEHLTASVEPLLAPEALSFSRGLAFSSTGATTLPHITGTWTFLV